MTAVVKTYTGYEKEATVFVSKPLKQTKVASGKEGYISTLCKRYVGLKYQFLESKQDAVE
jgi:hypothetical protein